MTSSDPLAGGCPRCGDTVFVFSKGIQCADMKCAAYWTNQKAYDNELIARDLAGTRAFPKPAGVLYIPDEMKFLPKEDNAALTKQLDELIALVRFNTLKEVDDALAVSIAGREEVTGPAAIDVNRAKYQQQALEGMRKWIQDQMNG